MHCSEGAEDKERTIAELQGRIRALENEFRSKQGRAEDSLELMRYIFDQTQNDVSLAGPDGHFYYVNDAKCRSLGYTREELLSMHVWDVDLSITKDKWADAWQYMKRHGFKMFETWHRTKHGQFFWTEVSVTHFDFHGREYLCAFVRDISERRLAEEALRKSEEFLNNIFRSIQDGISVLDKDLNVLRVNHAMEKWYAHNMPLVGKKCYEAYHGRPEPCERCPSLRTIKSKTMQSEVVPRVGASGPEGWVELYTFPMLDKGGNVIGVIEHVRDITERKRAEEALSKNLAELVKAQEIGRLGSWSYDPDSENFDISDEVYRIFGFTPGAVEPTKDLLFQLIHPDDLERFRESFESPAPEGRRGGLDFRIIWQDGSVHYLHTYIDSVVRAPDGRVKTMSGIAQDITERKLAEKDLRLARFSIDRAADIALWVAQDGRIVYANEAACKALGYARQELLSLKASDVAHSFNDENWGEHWKEVKERGSFTLEAGLMRKDGSFFPGEITVNYLFYEGNEINCAYIRDITDRKRMEKALQEALSKAEHHAGELDALVASIADAMMVLDKDGNITYMNAEALRIFGYAPGDYRKPMAVRTAQLGARFPDGTPLRPGDMLAYRALRGETVNNVEMVFRRKGTSPIWIIASAAPIRDSKGGISGAVITLIDNTRRKRAEEALRESEEKFRTLADTAFGLIAVHRGGRFVYVNDHATVLTGYSKDELMKMAYWEIFAPESRELIKRLAKERLDGVAVPSNYETRILTRDGKTKWVNLSAGLFNYEGKPSVVATLFDITNAKNAEEALKNEKAQAELYLDLMGHDINNMHQIALGYLELARDMPAGGEQAEFIDKSVEVLRRSTQLIRNVRKLQKLRDGVFRTQVVDVCKVVSDVQRELGAVPSKPVMLNFNGRERCLVLANELLHDVFANLVSNAIKHTGDRAEIVIDLDVINDNGSRYCRVFVEDNGPGIPGDFKAKIFDRTLKGTNNSKGMGLGLYLVKSLVDSYGGRVWVEDRVFGDHTKGARFVVMLPAVEK